MYCLNKGKKENMTFSNIYKRKKCVSWKYYDYDKQFIKCI